MKGWLVLIENKVCIIYTVMVMHHIEKKIIWRMRCHFMFLRVAWVWMQLLQKESCDDAEPAWNCEKIICIQVQTCQTNLTGCDDFDLVSWWNKRCFTNYSYKLSSWIWWFGLGQLLKQIITKWLELEEYIIQILRCNNCKSSDHISRQENNLAVQSKQKVTFS